MWREGWAGSCRQHRRHRPGSTISSLRGKPTELDEATLFLATVHPSYLLRISDREVREREERAFAADLALIKEMMDEGYRA